LGIVVLALATAGILGGRQEMLIGDPFLDAR
jgi:hypothetical protein